MSKHIPKPWQATYNDMKETKHFVSVDPRSIVSLLEQLGETCRMRNELIAAAGELYSRPTWLPDVIQRAKAQAADENKVQADD